ncbi:MAG TPA: methyltransferase [Cyanothece sp. UBA12306]|nr:methyltransferase [Cyanothece sp. UBA12306]
MILRKFFTFLSLARNAKTERDKEALNFRLAEFLSSLVYPKFTHTEEGKIWLQDQDFFKFYQKYRGNSQHYRSADRKYFVNSLLCLVEHLPGDTAECGVYRGATSELICQKFQHQEKIHYAFDSFEGLSKPLDMDGEFWQTGSLTTSEDIARQNLASYSDKIKFYKGWIPERFPEVNSEAFCFVHIDVDLYEPTLESLKFFYPKLVVGGIILCDDYGFSTCPGAKLAFDEYMSDKIEKIVHVPTGQAFILKR